MTQFGTGLSRRGAIRLVGAAGAYAALGGRTSAQSAAWAQVVEAAKKEGNVTIYSGQGLLQLNDLAARVKRDLGITVQVVRDIDSALTTKINAERESGRAICDVFVDTNVVGIKARSQQGHVVAPAGPAFANPVYDRKERVPESTYFEVSAAILTFSWNKELFPKGMKDYPDVLDPALAGKIGIPATLAPAFVDFYLFLEEAYGKEFLPKLAALKPRVYPSALPMAQAVVSGEIGAALSTQPLIDEIQKGAPVAWGLAPKSWGARFYGQILKVAPKPNAAQVLANYMVTQSGQEAVARLAASALPSINGAVAYTGNVRHLNLARLTPEFLSEFRERWKKLFQPG
jgi:iron(III) transport system substrate-binding protein